MTAREKQAAIAEIDALSAGPDQPVDRETRDRLRALGYAN
jgi:hypothetical protein